MSFSVSAQSTAFRSLVSRISPLYFSACQPARVSRYLPCKGKRPVPDTIDEFKNVFVDWRYIYEQQHGQFALSFGELALLIDALETECSERDSRRSSI